MSLRPLALVPAFVLAACVTTAARAGETACRLEGGVVVVPAEVAGVAGDFILDSAEPQTILAETQAQEAGYADTSLSAEVTLAGQTQADVALAVKDLDVRTGLFPTPIAGVIGADVLKAYVADFDFTPCRLTLSRPGEAPPFGPARRLPLTMVAGLPAVTAKVSDGVHALSGAFVLATGADAPIRLSDAVAAVPGADRPKELYPNGVLRATLGALTLAGREVEGPLAGLVAPQDPGIAGELGAALFVGRRLRLDMPAGALLVAHEKGPGRSRGLRSRKARPPP